MHRSSWMAIVLIAALASGGCAGFNHSTTFEAWEGDPIQLVNRRDATAAVVLAPPALHDVYRGEAQGHSFEYTGMHGYMETLYRGCLGKNLKSVDFVASQPESGYDYVIYPSLDVQISNSFVSTKCTVVHGIEIQNAAGEVIAQRSESRDNTQTVIAAVEYGCQVAFIATVENVIYDALARIDID